MKTLATILFSIFSVLLMGQQATLSGSIAENQTPVAYATIVVYNGDDSSMVKADYSDDDGNYSFLIDPGRYYLEISYVGMETYLSETFQLSADQNMEREEIQLQSASQELEEVTIEAKKPMVQVLPDKTVFNVEGNINSSGNSAFELLRKSPGVVVDNNENIILRGKSGVIIYINGKRSVLTGDDLVAYLRSLRSEDIKAIELITSPSSKYDAEGNAGIINIELRREKGLGTTGSISLGYALGITPKYNGSARFNTRTKKINAYGSYSHFNGEMENTMDIRREQLNDLIIQSSEQIQDRRSHNYRGGLDYFINENQTVGVLVHGYSFNGSRYAAIASDIYDIKEDVLAVQLLGNAFGESQRDNINANFNYEWKLGNNQKFNVDLDYGLFEAENTSFQPNDYIDPNTKNVILEQDYTTIAPTTIDIYSAKADYEAPLWQGQLGVGVKYASVQSQNDFSFYNHVGDDLVLDTERSNDFDYTENVAAAYVNYKGKTENLGYQFGLRVENTDSEGNLVAMTDQNNKNVKRSYLDFFPSAGLSYTLSDNHTFRLSYSRRIDRPNYQNLNPFEFRLDELTFQKGNPFLNPQYTNAIELSHQFRQRLNTSLSYSKTTDLMTQLTDTAGVRESFITFLNLAEQTNIGLNVSYPFSPTKWWSVFANVSANRIVNEGSFEGTKVVDLKVNTASVNIQNTFNLKNDWSLELSGFYQAPSVWGGNFETESIGSMDIGVSKKLWDGRANLKASLSDVFFTMPWDAQNNLGILEMQIAGTWESRQFRVNFSYQLGHRDVKNARRRGSGLEKEKSRLESNN